MILLLGSVLLMLEITVWATVSDDDLSRFILFYFFPSLLAAHADQINFH
jgi:hypothetical protein